MAVAAAADEDEDDKDDEDGDDVPKLTHLGHSQTAGASRSCIFFHFDGADKDPLVSFSHRSFGFAFT